MNRFRTFLIGLLVTFGFPWLFMVVVPYATFAELEPLAYDEEADEMTGTFPAAPAGGMAEEGRRIYLREGCAYCHTQVVRPTYAGMDSFKAGFGQSSIPEAPVFARQTLPHDFIGVDYAPLGYVRNGPDLANVGYRIDDPKWHYRHLYNPRLVRTWSNMPGFDHLFVTRKIAGAVPAADALNVTGEDAPRDGYEVVPGSEARALVGYLMSLRMDSKVPSAFASAVHLPRGGVKAAERPVASGEAGIANAPDTAATDEAAEPEDSAAAPGVLPPSEVTPDAEPAEDAASADPAENPSDAAQPPADPERSARDSAAPPN